jgi:hypothetical protein
LTTHLFISIEFLLAGSLTVAPRFVSTPITNWLDKPVH